jgi:hypothetical protein
MATPDNVHVTPASRGIYFIISPDERFCLVIGKAACGASMSCGAGVRGGILK